MCILYHTAEVSTIQHQSIAVAPAESAQLRILGYEVALHGPVVQISHLSWLARALLLLHPQQPLRMATRSWTGLLCDLKWQEPKFKSAERSMCKKAK